MLECFALFSLVTFVQPLTAPEPPRIQSDSPAAQTLLIRSDRIIVRPGEELSGAVLVQDGRIIAVGPGLTAPEGARTLEGAVVCAGYFDAWSTVGVVPGTVTDKKLNPASRVIDGVNTHAFEKVREDLLRAGVTSVRVQGGNGANVGGTGAIVRNDPNSRHGEIALLADACVAAAIGVSESNKVQDVFQRIDGVDKLVKLIEGGRSYRDRLTDYDEKLAEWQKEIDEKAKELEKDFKKAKKKRDSDMEKAEEDGKEFKEKKYKEDKKPKAPRLDANKAAMARVEAGEMPLVVEVHRVPEIRELLAKTAVFGRLRLILAGATEASSLGSELAARSIPVIVWPTPMGNTRLNEYRHHDLELAGKLHEAGVEVLFGSGGQGTAGDLSALAALAVGNGMDRNAALEALTIGPARNFDVGDRIGTVEPGKEADLLVLTGDPLAVSTRPAFVILNGVVVVEP